MRLKEEVKNKDLTETNKILSDRIKLFEEKRVKDAYDSIQPSDIPTNKTNLINEKMPSSQLLNHPNSGFLSQATDYLVL